jgi:hypothetical protein
MTTYNVELLDPTALSRIPSTQEVAEICLQECRQMLTYLSQRLVIDNYPGQWTVTLKLLILKEYISLLERKTPTNPGVAYPFEIINFCVTTRIGDSLVAGKQYFSMSTFESVHPRILLGVVVRLLENSVINIKPLLTRSLSIPMFNESVQTIQALVKELFEAFPQLDTLTPPDFVSVTMKVKFDTREDDVRHLV